MAHFRESNAVFLEILGASPAAGVPLEVDVFDGASPSTLIQTLDGATNIAFTMPFNDVGGGGFRISRHDPKATPEIVGREHLFKIKVGGIYRFAFWGEHRELVTLDNRAEEGGEFWEISGRGAIAYLDRATMANYSLIGDDPQPGGKWPLHLAGTGSSLGAMFNRCLQERLAEPGSAIEFLTQNWNYTLDSQSNVWGDTAEITVTTGDSLLDIWKQFTALGMDSRMRHDLRLEAYVELGRHYDVVGGTGTVVLRAGKHFLSTIRRAQHTNEIKSRLWVKGSGDAWYEISDAGLEADPYVRRREGSLSFGNSDDPSTLQRAGNAELAARAQQVEGGISLEVTNNGPGDYVPFVDYDVGDWITIHEPGVYDLQTVRVVGLSIEQVEQSYTTRLDLNTIEYDELVQLARRMNRGGGQGGSSGASAGLNAPASSGESALHPGVAVHDNMGLVTDAGLASALTNLDLNGLVDVDTTTTPPEDQQALVFDEASGLWLPGDVAAGGGGGGAALAYVGKNAVGASMETCTQNRVFAKRITIPAGGAMLGDIEVYLQPTGGVLTGDVEFYLLDDNGLGTAPDHYIAHWHYGSAGNTPVWSDPDGTTDARWISGGGPGRYLPAGYYWIGFHAGTTYSVAYDTGGSDQYQTSFSGQRGVDWGYVGGGWSPTVTTRDYSIRAVIVTPSGGGVVDWPVGHPDRPPAIANAMDDEFRTSPLNPKWTVYDPDAAMTVDSSLTRGDHLYLNRTNTGARLVGIYQALPAFPCTFEFKCSATTQRSNYTRGGGIGLLQATLSSNRLYIGQVFEGSPKFGIILYSGDSGFGGNVWGGPQPWWQAIYYRVRINSATSVDIWYSADGIGWRAAVLAYNPGFTPTRIGPMLAGEGATVEAWWDWFRRTA